MGLEAAVGGEVWRLGRADWVGAAVEPSTLTALWFRKGDAPPQRFEFEAPVRPHAAQTLLRLRSLGIEPRILSGDRSDAVEAIARRIGARQWQGGVGPKEKAAVLQSLKAEGRHVLMVGDGINDAAALSLAHVSMSPASASDAAQTAADIVFNGASLGPVVISILAAREARRRVLQNFALATAYNAVAIPLAAFGLVTPLLAAIAMAASSLVVTLNALRITLPREEA